MQSSSYVVHDLSREILPCRQELQERHREAFLSVDELIEGSDPEWKPENWPSIVMTYMGHDPKHSNPRGQLLQLLVDKLKTLVDGRWGIVLGLFEPLSDLFQRRQQQSAGTTIATRDGPH